MAFIPEMESRKQLRLKHALHNERACRYLDKKADFTDWVITTAFYSSLHFLDHKILPYELNHGGRKTMINNIGDYKRAKGLFHLNKHKAFCQLVEEEAPIVSIEYNELKDICWTARYVDYKHDRDTSKKAKESLKKIKDYCKPSVPPISTSTTPQTA